MVPSAPLFRTRNEYVGSTRNNGKQRGHNDRSYLVLPRLIKVTIVLRANRPSWLSRVTKAIAAGEWVPCSPRFSGPIKIDQHRFFFFPGFSITLAMRKSP